MTSNRKRKLEIEADLEKNPNDPRYKLITPVTKKSSIWANFQQVEFEGMLENFARCNNCNELLSCSAKTGTGSLLRHKCSRKNGISVGYKGIRIQKLPMQQIHLTRFALKKLPECSRIEIKRQQVSFVAKDLRPLNITEGEGFQKFCQTLINIGAQYGHQSVKDILTSKTNLERNLIPTEYNRIKNELEMNLSANHLAFTADKWTEEYTKRSFLTLNAHYINDDFNLKANVLGTRELTSETNIDNCVLEILKQFNVEEKLKNGVIVTANGPDIKAAFRNYKRLSCACHNLNLTMEEALEKSNVLELNILIEESRKLLNFLMNSGLNDKLIRPLKRANTHWSSIYTILINILYMHTEIKKLLTTKNEISKITAINLNLLQKLVDFLGPFKECSEQFSSETNPTIHEYVLWYEKLMKHCTKTATDSEIIAELKVYTAGALKNRLEPSTLHNVAIFLNPPYKQLKFMSEDLRTHTMATIKTMLEEHLQPISDCKDKEIKDVKPFNSQDQMPQTSTTFEYIECSSSGNMDLFDEFKDEYDEDDSNVSTKEIDTELQIYLKRKVNHCKILDFWRDTVDLPLLRSLSRQILNIPVSSAIAEKVFSTSARILGERRMQLPSESVDQILFLNKNL